MSKSKLSITLALSIALAACASRDEDVNPGTDAGNNPGTDAGVVVTDAGGSLAVDPPAESVTWPCRSGVDADGEDYLEFNPRYLGAGTEPTAMVVGDAPNEGIVGYFGGSYVTASKDSVSGWYRYELVGAPGTWWTLTYGRCVDATGNNASCWAQYGSGLPAANAGPFRWNSSGTSYACKGKVGAAGRPAVPHGQ